MATDTSNLVPASNFVLTLNANLDNELMDDAAFREFVRNSLKVVKEVVEYEHDQVRKVSRHY